jgi:adenylylsulfate kinase-like enzyme
MVASGEAVLITGVYGTGKTSVCEELAERLEAAGVAYGAIDLDWLGWFSAPELDAAAVQRTYLNNLAAVASNYADAGVLRLVLAGAVRSNAVLDATRAAIPFPLRVVRLTLPLDEIERRLSDAVTVGRARDLRNAGAVARARHRCRRRRPRHRQ